MFVTGAEKWQKIHPIGSPSSPMLSSYLGKKCFTLIGSRNAFLNTPLSKSLSACTEDDGENLQTGAGSRLLPIGCLNPYQARYPLLTITSVNGNGETLRFESLSGSVSLSDVETLDRAVLCWSGLNPYRTQSPLLT